MALVGYVGGLLIRHTLQPLCKGIPLDMRWASRRCCI